MALAKSAGYRHIDLTTESRGDARLQGMKELHPEIEPDVLADVERTIGKG